jgi:hypothetical protein
MAVEKISQWLADGLQKFGQFLHVGHGKILFHSNGHGLPGNGCHDVHGDNQRQTIEHKIGRNLLRAKGIAHQS